MPLGFQARRIDRCHGRGENWLDHGQAVLERRAGDFAYLFRRAWALLLRYFAIFTAVYVTSEIGPRLYKVGHCRRLTHKTHKV